jgi:DNA-binding MarR family transcriptional regulator
LLYENPQGLTQDEVAVALGMPTQTASPRFTDLFKHGLVIRKPIPGTENYEVRLTRSSSSAAVCVLSPDWQRAALDYRARKRMEKQMQKAEKRALAENAELRAIIADLVEIIDEKIPFKEAALQEALAAIRKEYLSCKA